MSVTTIQNSVFVNNSITIILKPKFLFYNITNTLHSLIVLENVVNRLSKNVVRNVMCLSTTVEFSKQMSLNITTHERYTNNTHNTNIILTNLYKSHLTLKKRNSVIKNNHPFRIANWQVPHVTLKL